MPHILKPQPSLCTIKVLWCSYRESVVNMLETEAHTLAEISQVTQVHLATVATQHRGTEANSTSAAEQEAGTGGCENQRHAAAARSWQGTDLI